MQLWAGSPPPPGCMRGSLRPTKCGVMAWFGRPPGLDSLYIAALPSRGRYELHVDAGEWRNEMAFANDFRQLGDPRALRRFGGREHEEHSTAQRNAAQHAMILPSAFFHQLYVGLF